MNAVILSFEEGTGTEETMATPAGNGTADDPFNVAKAIEKAKSIGETATTEEYYIKGKVATVKEQYSAFYGNGTFELVDEGFTAVFTAYRILYINNQKWVECDQSVNVGDELVVVGKIVNYKGFFPETASGYLYSLNGKTTYEQSALFSVENTSISVNPHATSAEIIVKGNVTWSATSTDCELVGSNGTGTGTITAKFTANNTESPIVHTVIVKTEADVQNKESFGGHKSLYRDLR